LVSAGDSHGARLPVSSLRPRHFLPAGLWVGIHHFSLQTAGLIESGSPLAAIHHSLAVGIIAAVRAPAGLAPPQTAGLTFLWEERGSAALDDLFIGPRRQRLPTTDIAFFRESPDGSSPSLHAYPRPWRQAPTQAAASTRANLDLAAASESSERKIPHEQNLSRSINTATILPTRM